jgi:intermembrane space import and assembly protein 40
VQAQLDAQAQKDDATPTDGSEGGMGGLEEEAGQQGAFNPETGEINWDCPCLGGMADGPCGDEFKAAFSCFVYSQEEPKGVDCIENFKYVLPGFGEGEDGIGADVMQEYAELLPPVSRSLWVGA